MQGKENPVHPYPEINSPFCDFLSSQIPGMPKLSLFQLAKRIGNRVWKAYSLVFRVASTMGSAYKRQSILGSPIFHPKLFLVMEPKCPYTLKRTKRTADKVCSGQWSRFLRAENPCIFEGKAHTPLGCQSRESWEVHPLRFDPEEPNFFWGPGKLPKVKS